MESLELLILQNLLYNKDYFMEVIPFVEANLFSNYGYSIIAKIIRFTYEKKNEQITPQLVKVAIEGSNKLTPDQYNQISRAYEQVIVEPVEQPIKTLIEQTEKYFRRQKIRQSLANATIKFDGSSTLGNESLRELEDAVNFTFDHVGYYNYLGEFESRLSLYQESKKKYPFPLTALNDCTSGGMNSKSLSIAMATTGGGKSIFLCNCASHLIREGYNVLYITCEMSVDEISKRIDADLLSATQDSITNNLVEAEVLRQRMNNLDSREKWGNLYIKEYPAGYATSSTIRRDIDEILRLNEIKIDVLVVDYLNLLSTSRYSTKNSNTYTLVKAIAEELRGLGQEYDIPVVSATQSNRSALNKDLKLDIGLEGVSESFGLPQTADFMFNIVRPDDPNWQQGHYVMLSVLKNRWGDPNKKYIKVHLDTSMARFSDVEGHTKATQDKPDMIIVNNKNKNSTKTEEEEPEVTRILEADKRDGDFFTHFG